MWNKTNLSYNLHSIYTIVYSTGNSRYEAIRSADGHIVDYSATLATLETRVLALMTEGILYLKKCAHSYTVTIPEHVTVVEHLYGKIRKFINSLDAEGSDYQFIVKDEDGVTYNFVRDINKNYINSLISTVGSTTLQGFLNFAPTESTITLMQQVVITDQLVLGSKSITIRSNCFGSHEHPNIVFFGSAMVFYMSFTPALPENVVGYNINGQRQITFENLYIEAASDGIKHGLNCFHVTGEWGTSVNFNRVWVNGMAGRGFYSNVVGLYVNGSMLKITNCGKEGYLCTAGQQINLQDLWCTNNGPITAVLPVDEIYQIKVTGWSGSIGRVVVGGDGVTDDWLRGIWIITAVGLHIGILHCEDLGRYALVLGNSTATATDCRIVDIGAVWGFLVSFNSDTPVPPFLITSATCLSIGSIIEFNTGLAPPYTISLAAYACERCTLQNTKLLGTIYRSTWAKDNGLAIINDGSGAVVYP